MMTQVISKVGIHCVGPARTGYGSFLQTINAAGRRLSVIKVRDDFGAIDEPLQLWPDVLTIGAMTDFDRLPFDVNKFIARARLNPKVKYWEVLNEDDASQTYAAKADLYISILPTLKAAGLRLCMFNCSSGAPPFPHEDGGVAYREIARACKFARDGGYDALLGLHEYESDGGTIGRYKVLADYLATQNALLPIVITEYGYETFPGTSQHMATLYRNDPLYMRDPRVIGCADWTLGGGGWADSNYQRDLPLMADYIANVAPVEVDPPPPDPVAESYNGATAGAHALVIDGNGSVWWLDVEVPRNVDAGFPVMRDDVQHFGGLAERITYYNHAVYVVNAAGDMFRAIDAAPGWVRVEDEPGKVHTL